MANTIGKSVRLAIDGGTPVRTKGWRRWPEVSAEKWAAEVEPRLKSVYLSRTEGLPNPQAREFEQAWCDYSGCAHAILTSHGTDALMAAVAGALDADGLGRAGEMIVPNYTFIASATAPLALQCGVCLVDVSPTCFNLDPAAVEAAIGPNTVGIFAVHLGGHPAEMETLKQIAAKHGLALIEDCAQAHGAKCSETQVGAIGTCGGFSYQSSKNLTSGEGGLVTTNDLEVANRAYAYLNIGRPMDGERWEHSRVGWNFRSNEYCAAMLNARLPSFDAETDQRDANGAYLTAQLASLGGLTPPQREAWCGRHAYHLFINRYNPAEFGGRDRTEFLAALNAEGIAASSGYAKLLSEQDGIRAVQTQHPDRIRVESCPVTEAVIDDSVWFTQNMLLGDRADMDDIVEAVAKIKAAWG